MYIFDENGKEKLCIAIILMTQKLRIKLKQHLLYLEEPANLFIIIKQGLNSKILRLSGEKKGGTREKIHFVIPFQDE